MDNSKNLRVAVLVVEDESLIRMVIVSSLEDAGFLIYEAGNADKAILMFEEHADIRLVFTDINMPGECDGLELARRVHLLRPDIRLILTSGKIAPTHDELPSSARFLPKPYEGRALVRLVAAA